MTLFLGVKPDRAAEAGLGRHRLEVQHTLGAAAATLRWVPAERRRRFRPARANDLPPR